MTSGRKHNKSESNIKQNADLFITFYGAFKFDVGLENQTPPAYTWCIQNKVETGFDIILNLQHQLLHRTSILHGMDGIELCFASMY